LKISFEPDKLRKFYYYCDVNKNGSLQVREISNFIQANGRKKEPEILANLIQKFVKLLTEQKKTFKYLQSLFET
jgi:hypothetical protein